MPSFRRYGQPFVMAVSPSSATTQVAIAGDSKYPGIEKARNFRFINKTSSYVRLQGSNTTFAPVTETTGWCFGPGTTEIYASQLPTWVSVMSIATPDIPAATGTVELSYGNGE